MRDTREGAAHMKVCADLRTMMCWPIRICAGESRFTGCRERGYMNRLLKYEENVIAQVCRNYTVTYIAIGWLANVYSYWWEVSRKRRCIATGGRSLERGGV